MRKRSILSTAATVFALACFVFVIAAEAQIEPGWSAAAQFRDGIGARALALGGATTAIVDDATSVFWNPGQLCAVPLELSAMLSQPLGPNLGYSQQFVGAAGSAEPDRLGWGIGWLNATVKDIPSTEDPGLFDYTSSILLVGFGVGSSSQSQSLRLGTAIKIYREEMLEGEAHGFGWDLGGQFSTPTWMLAFHSRDISDSFIRWRGTGQEPVSIVPATHRLAAAATWLHGMITVASELTLAASTSPSFGVGVELRVIPSLCLRGGLRSEPGFGDEEVLRFSGGVGVGPIQGIIVDYAYVQPMQQGVVGVSGSHIVSARFTF